MTQPARGALVGLVVLGVAMLALVLLSTPWRTLPAPSGGPTRVDPARDFTSGQIAREDAFHRQVRPASYVSLALGLVVAGLFGLTPAGARLVGALARPFGGGWVWQVLLGCTALALAGRVVTLPFAAYAETVLRRYGLSTQTWAGWAVDVAKGFALSTGLTALALLGLYGLVRVAPRTWWAWAAAGAAALVVALSFAFPLLIEPVFNRFTPMPAGELRTSLLALAASDGVPVQDVLVADASRRTTTLNAYVSGFGSTRRIVVYDTLLSTAPPQEVRLVVAHELGHAKRQDVLHATVAGALGAAVAVCAVAVLFGWGALLRRAGVPGLADPRSLAALLFVLQLGGLLASPAGSLVSRRIEARADVHALDLTADPAGFAAMQRRLSVANLSDLDPNPVVYALFASHPTGPERIALARDWARLHEVAQP
jgi:STE24 endopeptidase